MVRASTSPRQASRSRATASPDPTAELCSAEMRHHLSLARILERDIVAGQMRAHPLAALLDDAGKGLLVKTCSHRDELVLVGCHHVVAEESRLGSQMVGPAFVHQAHYFVALLGI